MIQLRIRVEPTASALPRYCVGRINEKYRMRVASMLCKDSKPVAWYKLQAIPHLDDIEDPLLQRFRVPTRQEPFAILTCFHQTSTRCHDAAPVDAVLYNRLECPITYRGCRCPQ